MIIMQEHNYTLYENMIVNSKILHYFNYLQQLDTKT